MPNPSRDPRIDDPTNRWFFDPIAQCIVPLAVRLGISANAISVCGLIVGGLSALAYGHWQREGLAILGLLISLVWLVMDSLDGMVARATGTSSAFGRELDGWCDHCVFGLLYLALGWSLGGLSIWILIAATIAAHAMQASLYEAERDRFNRRLRGELPPPPPPRSRNPATRLYNKIALAFEPLSAPFDRLIVADPADRRLWNAYDRGAVSILRAMLPLSQNIRMFAIFLACSFGMVRGFLWLEVIPYSLLIMIGIIRLRRLETALLRTKASSQLPQNLPV